MSKFFITARQALQRYLPKYFTGNLAVRNVRDTIKLQPIALQQSARRRRIFFGSYLPKMVDIYTVQCQKIPRSRLTKLRIGVAYQTLSASIRDSSRMLE